MQASPAEAIARIFGTVNPLPNLAATWNMPPTMDAPVVRLHPKTDGRHLVAGIQDRMPVIIAHQDWPLWLGEIDGDPASLLRPAPEDVLRLWRVGKAVGMSKMTELS